jgi:hypothetical protein
MPKITADKILINLMGANADNPDPHRCPEWVSRAAGYFDPPAYGDIYETTACNFFPETTVRLPVEGLTRRGKRRLQRRRFDLVALCQIHYRSFVPIAIGVEIKVDKHDLLGDQKLADYLNYVHMMYLAVPPELENDALDKMASLPWSTTPMNFGPIGLLLVDELETTIRHHPDLVELSKRPGPTDTHLQELYGELLLRPFKLAKKEQKLFIQFV